MLEYLVLSGAIFCLLAFLAMRITRTAGINRNFMLAIIAVSAAMVLAFPYLMFSIGTSKLVIVYLFLAVVSVGLAGIKFKPDQILFKRETDEAAAAPHEQWLLADMEEASASVDPETNEIENLPVETVQDVATEEERPIPISEDMTIGAEATNGQDDLDSAELTEELIAAEESAVEAEPESQLDSEPEADAEGAEDQPEQGVETELVEEIEEIEAVEDIAESEEPEKTEEVASQPEESRSVNEDITAEATSDVPVDEVKEAEDSPTDLIEEAEHQGDDTIQGSIGEESEDKNDQADEEISDQADDSEAVPIAAEPIGLDVNDLIERGFDAKNKGNLKLAIIEFSRAMEICRDLYLFYLLGTELGELYKQSGLYQEAIRILIKTQTVVSSPDEYNTIVEEIAFLETVHDLLKAEGLPGLPYYEIPESIRANAQQRVSEK